MRSEISGAPEKASKRPSRRSARMGNLQCSSCGIKLREKIVVQRKTLLRIRRDHSLQNARGRLRYLRRDRAQICWMLLQSPQLCGGICAAIDQRFACHSMKQRCAKAVNVAADVLRLVAQSLGRDVSRRSPDHAVALWILRCKGSDAEGANLRRLFIDKQDVGRLYVPMNQTLPMSCAKSPRNLDANVEHLVFRQAALRLH